MYCENCGNSLGDKATFCPSCGALVKNYVKPVLAPLPGQKILPSEPIPTAEVKTDEPANDEQIPEIKQEEAPKDPEQFPINAPSAYNYNSAPNASAPVQKDNSWAGTVSLIMGILSVCSFGSGTLCVILAIIFGAMGRKTKKRKSAVAGIILAVISVVLFIVLIAAIVLGLMPSEFYYIYNGITDMYYI